MSDVSMRLTNANLLALSRTAILAWTSVQPPPIQGTELHHFVVNIYSDEDLTHNIYSHVTSTTARTYTIPGGVLDALTNYWIRITAVIRVSNNTFSSVLGVKNQVTTNQDDFNIIFLADHINVRTSTATAKVLLSWQFIGGIIPTNGQIEPASAFDVNTFDLPVGTKVATIDRNTTFILRADVFNPANGQFVSTMRQLNVTFTYVPPPLIEGEFPYSSVRPGDHIIKANTNYILQLNPVKINAITIFLTFLVDGVLTRKNVSTVNFPVILKIGEPIINVPIISNFLPTKTLAPQMGVSASWGYTAQTTENTTIENPQVETFKYVNLTGETVGGIH